MTVILGIDPGLSGALAFIELDALGQPANLHVYDMPVTEIRTTTRKNQSWVNTPGVADLVRQHNPSRAFIELVSAMPGQGVTSMFRFGHSLGAVVGVLGALAVPTETITPVQWKTITRTASAPDDASRHRVLQLFPGHSAMFSRKKDHGRADATLIAWAGYIRS